MWVILRRLNCTPVGEPLSPTSYSIVFLHPCSKLFRILDLFTLSAIVWNFKGLVALCHCFFFIYLRFSSPSYSYNTFIRRHSPRFLSISSLLVSSVGKTSLGCRAEKPTHYHLSYAARWNFIPILKLCCCRHWALQAGGPGATRPGGQVFQPGVFQHQRYQVPTVSVRFHFLIFEAVFRIRDILIRIRATWLWIRILLCEQPTSFFTLFWHITYFTYIYIEGSISEWKWKSWSGSESKWKAESGSASKWTFGSGFVSEVKSRIRDHLPISCFYV